MASPMQLFQCFVIWVDIFPKICILVSTVYESERSTMVVQKPSKLLTWVRSPSLAPLNYRALFDFDRTLRDIGLSMKDKKKIPEPAIPRLSLYSRALHAAGKIEFISSEELASLAGVKAAQVRRDLTYFGQFGTPGKGYNVKKLHGQIVRILGGDKEWNVALVGVGNLGAAFLHFEGFRQRGFNIVCAFDRDESKVDKDFGTVKVQSISDLQETLKKGDINIAIVAVPGGAAEEVMNALSDAGIKAILNFTSFRPQLPKKVQVLNMNLTIALEQLAYFLTKETKDNVFFV